MKPCPFCGSTRLSEIFDSFGAARLRCEDCRACGPVADRNKDGICAAIAAWEKHAGEGVEAGTAAEPAAGDAKLCDNCGLSFADPPHPCPFKEDVHGDSTTLCDCCAMCQQRCLRDI